MTEIDYIAQVRKVYPHAVCEKRKNYSLYYLMESEYGGEITTAYSPERAWQRAYEHLKKQGKI